MSDISQAIKDFLLAQLSPLAHVYFDAARQGVPAPFILIQEQNDGEDERSLDKTEQWIAKYDVLAHANERIACNELGTRVQSALWLQTGQIGGYNVDVIHASNFRETGVIVPQDASQQRLYWHNTEITVRFQA